MTAKGGDAVGRATVSRMERKMRDVERARDGFNDDISRLYVILILSVLLDKHARLPRHCEKLDDILHSHNEFQRFDSLELITIYISVTRREALSSDCNFNRNFPPLSLSNERHFCRLHQYRLALTVINSRPLPALRT